MLSFLLILLCNIQLTAAVVTSAVEGCFSDFKRHDGGTTKYKSFGEDNSNDRCQRFCRDNGNILSATHKGYCFCSDQYPKGKKVDDTSCNTPCAYWMNCHSPQSCCGGPNRFSVSLVGNVDVPKQILTRLKEKWDANGRYRSYIARKLVSKVKIQKYRYKWSNNACTCLNNNYGSTYVVESGDPITFRSVGGRIVSNVLHCRNAPSTTTSVCYNERYVYRVSKCKSGYFLNGAIYKLISNQYTIEYQRCCKPAGLEWGECKSFRRSNKVVCGDGFYSIGGNICCTMRPSPTFVIKMKKDDGTVQECTMKSYDSTYKCKTVRGTHLLALKRVSYKIEDRTELSMARPKPLPDFRPVICAPNTECTLSREVTISKSSTLTVGAGFTIGVSGTMSVETEVNAIFTKATTTLSATLSAETSFSKDKSNTEEISTTDSINVKVDVPDDKTVTIDLKRVTQDLLYYWKADFRVIGTYTLRFGDQEVSEDITRVLSGNDRLMHAFGKWYYPGTDFIKVIVTSRKYGYKKEKDCGQLQAKKRGNCEGKIG